MSGYGEKVLIFKDRDSPPPIPHRGPYPATITSVVHGNRQHQAPFRADRSKLDKNVLEGCEKDQRLWRARQMFHDDRVLRTCTVTVKMEELGCSDFVLIRASNFSIASAIRVAVMNSTCTFAVPETRVLVDDDTTAYPVGGFMRQFLIHDGMVLSLVKIPVVRRELKNVPWIDRQPGESKGRFSERVLKLQKRIDLDDNPQVPIKNFRLVRHLLQHMEP